MVFIFPSPWLVKETTFSVVSRHHASLIIFSFNASFYQTLWSGAVADPTNTDASTEALRYVTKSLHKDERFDMSLLTVGDGTTLARLR